MAYIPRNLTVIEVSYPVTIAGLYYVMNPVYAVVTFKRE